ncbi:MAG: hypothetical protein M1832_001099, partial [Thelocarpon impressellum]
EGTAVSVRRFRRYAQQLAPPQQEQQQQQQPPPPQQLPQQRKPLRLAVRNLPSTPP